MRQCRLFHLARRVIDVTTVVLVISTHVDHWALERFIRPFHSSRFQIDVTCENDDVSIAGGGFEPGELIVQVGIDLELHERLSVIPWVDGSKIIRGASTNEIASSRKRLVFLLL